ncbi:ribbon-helix-helix domain-containing protein [Enterovirga rhinocerotis]|uniref:Antitoxin ParD1/3/4 n=1 Tax=Enterovirga rhinocerotis TaxID=1339210 RepID=A0A4R7CDN5_9HYPH|nr:type II toxin-antitoxin system ParD family antitoxin [Enterovirga rhinocerotis]TDR94947.1 antitoxin ParD1/3/4 [Enterovirga rhinocerotis]
MAVKTIAVSIPEEFGADIDCAVAAGEYGSREEVVADALRVWTRRQEARAEELRSLKAGINAALDDPRPTLSLDEVKAHLQAVIAKSRARRDAAA